MPVTITDIIASFNTDGSETGKAGLAVYCYPLSNTVLRQDSGGTLRPILPNSNLPAAYQYGISVTTDSSGNFCFQFCEGTEQYPTTQTWAIALPSGLTLQGVPPSVSGPLKIYDLLNTYSWAYASGTATGGGTTTEQSGEIAFTGQDTWAVLFSSTGLSSSTYTISLSLSTDTSIGGSPTANWANRSKTGFTINLSQAFNGTLTWRAHVE